MDKELARRDFDALSSGTTAVSLIKQVLWWFDAPPYCHHAFGCSLLGIVARSMSG
jgi:hypothetical protein